MSFTNIDLSTLFNGKAFDVKALVDAQNRNIETLVQVGKVLAATSQNLVKRQVELTQANLKESAENAKIVMSVKDLEASITLQAELAKAAADKANAQVRELSEIASQGGNEAFSLITKRAKESAAELSALTGLKAAA
jgi:phasin family protein